MAKYLTIQNNVNTSIVSGDLLGQIGFASSVDSDGGDAIKITAAISAEAEGTFNASANPAALIFSTGPDMTATGQLKITNGGHFVPLYNAQKDLGDSSNYFRTLYVSGIDFNGLGTQTLPFNDFNVAANTDGVTVVDGNTITFTGAGDNVVSRDGQTIIISGTGTAGGGGMTSWTIADGSGNTEAVGDADTLYISGAGSVVTDYNTTTNVMTISGAAGGGGGTPGGSVNQIQINDGAGGFTAATNSDRFVYDDSTNTFDLGRQSADNVAGGQFTNYWFANNFCVGGGNFSATMDSDANNNTAVGIDALGSLTFGDDNVAIGYQAGDALTASDDNTIIGSQAGSAFGNNTNDNRNVIIGYQAASAATDIASNVIIGYQAGSSAAGPDGSVMIGAGAGFDSDADYNVLIGYECGYKADGNYNIYIGKPQSSAGGAPNVTGSGNLILGWNFDSINNAIYGLPNGYSSTASEQFAIANSLVGDFSAQRIGVGEAAINALDATLHVIPQNSSDVVLKVEGAAAQSANLTEWQNSSSVVQAHVDATGGISGTSYTFADGTIQTTAAAGGGTPGGSDTHVQFNDGGSTFGGNAGFTYDKTAQKMYSRSYYTNITDSGNITTSVTLDLDESNFHQVTLSGNPITIAVSNGDVGQRFIIRLKQDNTGSRTVNWFSTISWPGGGPPTLSAATGVADLLGFVVTAANEYDGFLMVSGIY